MSALRKWQTQCIGTALRHYKTHNHFFCQATPGAGKTRMAAELAKSVVDSDQIDFVICFAPSCEVVDGFVRTFEQILEKPLNGFIGAAGAAFTYQAMEHRDTAFWRLFDECRILAVFDEIHHCAAGNHPQLSNAWGQKILQKIQDRARFTLALSGTPWRSDERYIALARYSNPEGQLIVDYRYGLSEAVNESVCRSPKIVLVDNENVQLLENDGEPRSFNGIARLLRGSRVTYDQLVQHEHVMTEMIRVASHRLNIVRELTPDAAGLVVATNIAHANRIAKILYESGESFCVVTNQTPDSKRIIEEFRNGEQRWIVAVGMVSEGTDIPRLQVCCYLSRIRTELHYRQVLGRILRRMGITDVSAWFYALEERQLTSYSHRIAEDLPANLAVVERVAGFDGALDDEDDFGTLNPPAPPDSAEGEEAIAGTTQSPPRTTTTSNEFQVEILFSQQYRQLLLSVF